jgi:hypothetical protein
MPTIHIRITESQTLRPTPARISITGPNGQSFAPLGRFAEFPVGINEAVGAGLWLGTEKWFPVDGGCEIKLPAGVPLRVRVTKGPEYVPIDQEVTLGGGQMAVRLSLDRWANPEVSGWHTGDGRAHFLSPHGALLEAKAEGLDVVNLLATEQLVPGQNGHLYPIATNLDAFGGQSPTLEGDGRQVVVNTFNTHPALGKLALLNTHRPVFPLTFGEDSDDWSLVDWCRQCHRKKGLAVWCDPFRPGALWGEALVALILGELDAVEFDTTPRMQPYYTLLDAGFVVPLVGSSGKQTNKVPLGAVRTYAKSNGATYSSWIEAVRAGRTYVSSGPLVEFTINGHGPGEPVELSSPGPVEIRVAAESVVPFERVEVLCQSEVVASAAASCSLPPWGGGFGWGVAGSDSPTPTLTLPHQGGGDKTVGRFWASIIQTVPVSSSSWLAVRSVGPAGSVLYPAAPVFAHTSPVILRVGGATLPHRQSATAVLRREVGKVKDWAETAGRYADPKWKAQLLARCDEALARLG